MRTSLLFAALVMAAAGCEPPPPGFARLGSFTMELAEGGLSESTIRFAYDPEKQGCQTLDEDFSVDSSGVTTDGLLFRGGTVRDGFFGETSRCQEPWASVLRPGLVANTVTITATSGGDTMVMEVQDMGGILTAQPILAPGGAVHAGQLLELQVGPGFDHVQWRSEAFVTVQNGSDFRFESVPISPPSAAGVLQVQLPSTLPPGATHIRVDADAHPTIARCEGAGTCSVPNSTRVELNVDVAVVP